MKRSTDKHQAGFTIIELLIASAIFSVVLLLCSYAMLQIGRTYSKGLVQSRAQEAARSVMEQFSESIQFGGTNVVLPAAPLGTTPTAFCINNYRYTYQLDRMVVDTSPVGAQHESYHALVVDTQPGSCGAAHNFGLANIPNAKELLSPNMRLAKLTITRGSNGLYTISIRIVVGADEILSPDHQSCVSAQSSGQFCAVSELTTTIQQRLNGAP